ncbi:MAG: hypothetical protein WD273_06435 [Trueperaceae bacterium]
MSDKVNGDMAGGDMAGGDMAGGDMAGGNMAGAASVDIPQGAVAAMESWLAENVGALLHAWIADDDKSVLAVVATVGEDAFDSETDGYDVDSIELHMLNVFDTVQDGWEVSVDNELQLGTLFGELANRFVNDERAL